MKTYEITPDKFLSKEERTILIRATKEKAELDRLKGRKTWPVRYALIDLAVFSGLRVFEIANLKIKDLHLDTKKGQPYIHVHQGKGGKDRYVYLAKELVKRLKVYLADKPSLDHSTDDDAPLFPGPGGGHVPTITLQKSFKKATEAAGLPRDYSIHALRHTYATYALEETKNLRFVQKQLGHASLNMTSLYADISPEENARLADMVTA